MYKKSESTSGMFVWWLWAYNPEWVSLYDYLSWFAPAEPTLEGTLGERNNMALMLRCLDYRYIQLVPGCFRLWREQWEPLRNTEWAIEIKWNMHYVCAWKFPLLGLRCTSNFKVWAFVCRIIGIVYLKINWAGIGSALIIAENKHRCNTMVTTENWLRGKNKFITIT